MNNQPIIQSLARNLMGGLLNYQKNLGIAILVSVLIGVGIAISTIVFQVYHALFLRPLPIKEPSNLVQLFESRLSLPPRPIFPERLFTELSSNSLTIRPVMAQSARTVAFRIGNHTERVYLQGVSDNYFSDLGVPLLTGRYPVLSDTQVAIISYHFWDRVFQNDIAIIGETIEVDQRLFQVIGITAKGFNGTTIDRGPDIHVRLGDFPSDNQRTGKTRFVEIIGRLQPNYSALQAQRELTPLIRRIVEEVPRVYLPESQFFVTFIGRGTSYLRANYRTPLILLFSCSILFMITISANVSGLLILQELTLQKDTEIRLALGVPRIAIFSSALARGLIPSLFGGFLGIAIVFIASPSLSHLIPDVRTPYIGIYPVTIDLSLNWEVMLFCLIIFGLSALASTIGPALLASRGDGRRLFRTARSHSRSRVVQQVLVVTQIAVLVVFSFLAISTHSELDDLLAVDAGLDIDNVVSVSIEPEINRYTSEEARSLQTRLLTLSRAIPNVDAGGISFMSVLRGTGLSIRILTPENQELGWSGVNTSVNQVGVGYFEAMGIRLLRGRTFRSSDGSSRSVIPVVANETFCKTFVPNLDAIGWQFETGSVVKRKYRIVGVVRDSKYRSLRRPTPPVYYTATYESNTPPINFVLNLHVTGSREGVLVAVQNQLRSLDPSLPISGLGTLRDYAKTSLATEYLVIYVASSFGLLAIVLSISGLFGLMAQLVSNARMSICIRHALGASFFEIVWFVLRRLLVLVLIGSTSGGLMSFLMERFTGGIADGIQWFDLATIGYVLLLLVLVVAVVAIIPVVRALNVHLSADLRHE